VVHEQEQPIPGVVAGAWRALLRTLPNQNSRPIGTSIRSSLLPSLNESHGERVSSWGVEAAEAKALGCREKVEGMRPDGP
jgi:hypothetical protein